MSDPLMNRPDLVTFPNNAPANVPPAAQVSSPRHTNRDNAAGASRYPQGIDEIIRRADFSVESRELLRSSVEGLRRDLCSLRGLAESLRLDFEDRHRFERLSLRPPTFGDSKSSCKRPMHFLHLFIEYVRHMRSPAHSFKYALSQALRGPANDWFWHVHGHIRIIGDFRRLFTARFWSERIQLEVRGRLESGRYANASRLSRSEYAIQLLNDAKELSRPPGEREVVELLTNHFEPNVQLAIRSRKIKTVDQLIELLDTTPATNQCNLN